MDSRATATWTVERLDREVQGRMASAAKFLEGKIKDALNVYAPRKKVISRLGEIYWRATTPAKRNAPPRRVTGLGRAGLAVKVEDRSRIVIYNVARTRTGFPYMDFHEGVNKVGKHPYIRVTFKKVKDVLERILGFKLSDIRTVITNSRPQRRNLGQDVSQ